MLHAPEFALPVSLGLIALIGAADYATGYEVRLAILYLVPIALSTWACGRRWGFAMALLGPAIWVASFVKQHPYTSDVYLFWENAVMGITFVLVVELIARLRASRAGLERQIMTILDAMPIGAYVTDHNGQIRYANRHLKVRLGTTSVSVSAADIACAFIPTAATIDGADADSREHRDSEFRSGRDGRRYRRQCVVLSGPEQPSLVLVMLIEIEREH